MTKYILQSRTLQSTTLPDAIWAKTKVKFFPVLAMKVYKESRGIAPLILKLKRCWRLINVTPRPLDHRKEPQYPLNRRLGGLHSRYGRSWVRTPHHPSRSLVTIPTAQYGLPIFWLTLTNSWNPEKIANQKSKQGLNFK
jgi:hypothetical protein